MDASQGPVLGSFVFNIFINDTLFFVDGTDACSYTIV